MTAASPPTRLSNPSAERNKGPILDAMRPHLPAAGVVLEVASGSGRHVVHFAQALPALHWQPTDPDPVARESIAGWIRAEGLANVRPPLALDVLAADPPVLPAQAVVCINMIHIAPPEATGALLRLARAVLPADGPLILYGPYRRAGVPTAASNEAFDADLRSRDARWGLRELETVTALAEADGFARTALVEMPANNLLVVFRRVAAA